MIKLPRPVHKKKKTERAWGVDDEHFAQRLGIVLLTYVCNLLGKLSGNFVHVSFHCCSLQIKDLDDLSDLKSIVLGGHSHQRTMVFKHLDVGAHNLVEGNRVALHQQLEIMVSHAFDKHWPAQLVVLVVGFWKMLSDQISVRHDFLEHIVSPERVSPRFHFPEHQHSFGSVESGDEKKNNQKDRESWSNLRARRN